MTWKWILHILTYVRILFLQQKNSNIQNEIEFKTIE